MRVLPKKVEGEARMSDYLNMLVPLADKGAAALFVIAAVLLLSGILKRLINKVRDSKHLAPIMAARLQTFRRWTCIVLTGLLLMEVLGVFGSAWGLISAGLAAMALGFVAAWSMLSNMTAALLLLTFQPFRLGDTVEMVEPNGTALGGRVVDLNLMYTTLSVQPMEGATTNGPQLLHIPNNLFFQKILRTTASHEITSKDTFFSSGRN